LFHIILAPEAENWAVSRRYFWNNTSTNRE